LVEGDDGLFKISGGVLQAEDWIELGFNIKLAYFDDVSEASFCGIIFDREDRETLTDPIEFLAKFGWSKGVLSYCGSKRRMMMLRAKAFSYIYQYPACPIITAYAQYALRMTRSYDIKHFVQSSKMFDTYERVRLLNALKEPTITKPIGIGSRLLVERKFGVSIADQLRIENELNNCQVLKQFCFNFVNFPDSWGHYGLHYIDRLDKYWVYVGAITNKINLAKMVLRSNGQVPVAHQVANRFGSSICSAQIVSSLKKNN
jgi:hypothetical protein